MIALKRLSSAILWRKADEDEDGEASGGLMVTKLYADLTPKTGGAGGGGCIEAIVTSFQNACQSKDFFHRCETLGCHSPSFHPNDYLGPGYPGYDKFFEALEGNHRTLQQTDATLGVVFYGTRANNIDRILQNGIDPNFCGVDVGDEYFAKRPGMSINYCLEVLVFVVVLPDTTIAGQKTSACTGEYVVVESDDFVSVQNNHLQLALGSLKFGSVDPAVLAVSQKRRTSFLNMRKQRQAAHEAQIEPDINANLVKRQPALLSRLLSGLKSAKPMEKSLHEIAGDEEEAFEILDVGEDFLFEGLEMVDVQRNELAQQQQELCTTIMREDEQQQLLMTQSSPTKQNNHPNSLPSASTSDQPEISIPPEFSVQVSSWPPYYGGFDDMDTLPENPDYRPFRTKARYAYITPLGPLAFRVPPIQTLVPLDLPSITVDHGTNDGTEHQTYN